MRRVSSIPSDMAKLRKPDSLDPLQTYTAANRPRPLRIVASGTLFVTNVLALPSFPTEASISRARSVSKTRGGSVANVLVTLGQFAGIDAMLVAPLAGNSEGNMLIRDLQREGVNTRFCKVWEGAGVPSAWVLESGKTSLTTASYRPPLKLIHLACRRVWFKNCDQPQSSS